MEMGVAGFGLSGGWAGDGNAAADLRGPTDLWHSASRWPLGDGRYLCRGGEAGAGSSVGYGPDRGPKQLAASDGPGLRASRWSTQAHSAK